MKWFLNLISVNAYPTFGENFLELPHFTRELSPPLHKLILDHLKIVKRGKKIQNNAWGFLNTINCSKVLICILAIEGSSPFMGGFLILWRSGVKILNPPLQYPFHKILDLVNFQKEGSRKYAKKIFSRKIDLEGLSSSSCFVR